MCRPFFYFSLGQTVSEENTAKVTKIFHSLSKYALKITGHTDGQLIIWVVNNNYFMKLRKCSLIAYKKNKLNNVYFT